MRNVVTTMLTASALAAIVSGCGSEPQTSELNDWTLNQSYYYRVDTSANKIGQGECELASGGPVDISYEGCIKHLKRKDYSTFKT